MDNSRQREAECEYRFAEGGPYSLLTLNQLPFLLFEDDREFIDGNNILAISSAIADVSILDYSLMNNHFHVVVEGGQLQVEDMVDRSKTMLRQYLLRRNKPRDCRLEIRIDPLTTLSALRRGVLYTDRNAYVARRDSTPTGYPWGGGSLLFNGDLWLMTLGTAYSELTFREKRSICHGRDLNLPGVFRCHNGMILKTSFVCYKRTESFFNSANQYFSMLLRHAESDVEFSRMIGESILLPNEDVFMIVSGWYPGQKLYSLTVQQRVDAAKRMKRELGSNNKQIAQVLRLPLSQVEAWFPIPR